MARLAAFTQSLRFGGDDTILLELVRAWPARDRWTVLVNHDHPGLAVYQEALAGRAELVPVELRTWRLRAALAAAKPDAVLISSGGFPPTAPTGRALLAARLTGAPRIILAAHNEPNLGAGLRRFWRAGRGRLLSGLCDGVVSVSQNCADKIAAACGRPVRVILNGTADAGIEEPDTLRRELGAAVAGPLIGAVGNLEARKGFRVLLESFRRLAAKRPDVQLVIIGAGAEATEESALRTLAANPALSGRARLIGFKPRAERFVAAFDVCAIPSLELESFGLAALAAMRAGRPAVASRVGGLPEVIAEGETGLLVPPGDPDALAAALESLVNDPIKARAMGQAGRVRAAERFSAARMAREYHEVLLGRGQMITS